MFGGNILFLDRSDINTDEIIPAKYLTEIYKKDLKDHLFEDLSLEGFSLSDVQGKQVVVTRDNFGCGSSREHAPWALEANSIRTVVASGFARIFRQNMYNCGLLPIELDGETVNSVFEEFNGFPSTCTVSLEERKIVFSRPELSRTYSFHLSDFHLELIERGGWVEYAHEKY